MPLYWETLLVAERIEGTSLDKVMTMKNKIHQLRGLWLDMHDKSVLFNARRYHKVQTTRADMINSRLQANTLAAFRRCCNEKKEDWRLASARGFGFKQGLGG